MRSAILHNNDGTAKSLEIEQDSFSDFLVYDGRLYTRKTPNGNYWELNRTVYVAKPDTISAEFLCQYNASDPFNGEATSLLLTPVVSNPPNKENLALWEGEPAGQITLIVTTPRAAKHFKLGRIQYVDFTLAPEADEDTAIWKQ